MATTDEISRKPACIAERFEGAASTSNLTAPDEWKPTDAFVLVASGLGRKGLGGSLLRLRAEWGRTALPHRTAAPSVGQYLTKIAPIVTRVEDGRSIREPDLERAKEMNEAEQKAIPKRYDAEILMVKHKLTTMPKVRDHLSVWAYGKVAEGAEQIVAEVLLYWLSDTCDECAGTRWEVIPSTGRLSSRKCSCCGGTGLKKEPQGVGQKMLDYINQCIYDWRQSTSDQLRNMSGRGKKA